MRYVDGSVYSGLWANNDREGQGMHMNILCYLITGDAILHNLLRLVECIK
jgi:hypothetical protein